MSVPALDVINDAALAIGDPAFTRLKRPQWLVILNQSQRDMARKLRLVRHTATFDIEDSDEYAMPDDCIQSVSFQWNDTPTNRETWRWLAEMFEDEFRAGTDGAFASGDPRKYLALTDTFRLYPRPDREIDGGGKITYWGMPDNVTDETTQAITIRDTARDTLKERMVIYGLRALDRFDKAREHEQEWIASLTTDREKFEDRSADRRPRLRPYPSSFGER